MNLRSIYTFVLVHREGGVFGLVCLPLIIRSRISALDRWQQSSRSGLAQNDLAIKLSPLQIEPVA